MKNFNCPLIDLATSYPDAIVVDASFVFQAAQELRAFGWQSKRYHDHFGPLVAASTICTTKLFFSLIGAAVAGAVDPGSGCPIIDEIAVRNSCSRFDGRSTRTLSRP